MSEKKFKGILICSDFDGTLAYQNIITPENLQAIRYFQENGGLFTVVSGRSPRFMTAYTGEVTPNTYMCGFNGTIIEDLNTGERIYDAPMSKAEVFAFVAEIIHLLPEVHIVEFQSDKGNVSFIRDKGILQLDKATVPEKVYKVLFVVPDEYSDNVLSRMQNLAGAQYTVSRSWINGIEIQKAGEDKGTAVRVLRRKLSDYIHCVIGVGDYGNDIPLLQEADFAVAVQDAVEGVKAVAQMITTTCRTDSLSYLIQKLEHWKGEEQNMAEISG